MTGSVKPWRRPAMMLGVLAVFGLLLRAQTVPVPAVAAVLYGTLCHTGDTDQPGPGSPAPDCDACVLCQMVHSDDGGIPILPARFVLRLLSGTIERPSIRLTVELRRAARQEGFQARAPPAPA